MNLHRLSCEVLVCKPPRPGAYVRIYVSIKAVIHTSGGFDRSFALGHNQGNWKSYAVSPLSVKFGCLHHERDVAAWWSEEWFLRNNKFLEVASLPPMYSSIGIMLYRIIYDLSDLRCFYTGHSNTIVCWSSSRAWKILHLRRLIDP